MNQETGKSEERIGTRDRKKGQGKRNLGKEGVCEGIHNLEKIKFGISTFENLTKKEIHEGYTCGVHRIGSVVLPAVRPAFRGRNAGGNDIHHGWRLHSGYNKFGFQGGVLYSPVLRKTSGPRWKSGMRERAPRK
jgi:hypothetical protein